MVKAYIVHWCMSLVYRYVTEYRIDHETELRKFCSSVTFDACTPCFGCSSVEEERSTQGRRLVAWIWSLLASRLLIFIAHLSTIIFGVVKVQPIYQRCRSNASTSRVEVLTRVKTKKFKLMLMRRAIANCSFCSLVVLLYLHPFRRNSLF